MTEARGLTKRYGATLAVFGLMGRVPGMTEASSVTILLGWAAGVLLLRGIRLVPDDANR